MTESPRFSLITVSDDPEYLYLLWKSTVQNEYPSSWEWVIGGMNFDAEISAWQRVARFAADTPNIHLLDLPPDTPKTLGGWYQASVEFSRGTTLIFHGRDMLFTPTTWSELHQLDVEGFLVHPTVDFEYLFDPLHQKLTQGPQIWDREHYLQLKGHHIELASELDFELLCRGFLAKFKVGHYSGRTFNFNPADLKESDYKLRSSISNTLFYQLVQQTFERAGGAFGQMIMTPGQEIYEGYAAIHWQDGKLVYKDSQLPVKDNSLSIIRARDVLNYIPRENVFEVMRALWKALKPEGWLFSATVSTRGAGAFADPRAGSYWNNLTFSIFCLDEVNPDFGGRFQYSRVFEHYPAQWHKDNQVPYVVADLKKLEV